MVPILAGILIIGLVYIASISASIAEWIAGFPEKITRTLIKKTLVQVSSLIISSQIERLCDILCTFLHKKIIQQILIINKYNSKLAKFFRLLLKISNPKDFSISGEQIEKLFKGKTKLNTNLNIFDAVDVDLPINSFLKIGFLLMLCFASFMMNFYYNHQAIKYDSDKISEEYDKKQDTQNMLDKNKNIVEKEAVTDMKIDFKNTEKK